MEDTRPENCRFRLQDEGKSYPRSSCQYCGKNISTGLGTHCTHKQDVQRRSADRAVVLLKAARDMLEKADEGPFVVDVMSETVFYDGTDCDGYCLKEDIENLFLEMGAA